MKNPLSNSLNGRLISLFIAMSVVPLAAIAVLSFNSAQDALSNKISNELHSLAVSRMEAVKILNEMRLQQASTFASGERVQDLFQLYNAKEAGASIDESQLKEASSTLMGEFSEFKEATGGDKDGFYKIKTVSMHGTVFYSSSDGSEVGKSIAQDPNFQKAKQQPVSFVEYDAARKEGARTIIVPVTAHGGQDTIGVVYASVPTHVASQILLNREGLGESGETYLVNSEGLMISESRFVEGAAFNQRVNTLPVTECFEKGTVVNGIYPDYRGIPVYGASACVKDAGIVLLAEYDVAEINAPITQLQNQYLLLGGPIVGAVGVAAFFISRSISRPIAVISRAAQNVSKGDLTVKMGEVKSKDEIGILSKSFTDMIGNIRELVKQAQDNSITISSTAEQMAASTEEVNASINQVSTSVQQIAKGTQDQAKRLEENNRIAEELRTTMKGVSRSAEEVAGQAMQTGKTAQAGQTAASDAAQRMTKIHDFVNKAVSDIKGISEKSAQIASALGVINTISDKTNLLALNAAIEAARAGEAGKGFAVVADEVKRLAEGSLKASEEIAKLVDEIKTTIEASVQNIESGSKEVYEGTDIINKALSSLEAISTEALQTAKKVQEIASSTQNQVRAAENVTKLTAEVASVAEETAASAEEVSAATEQQTASMQEVTNAAQELAKIAEKSQGLITKFKTDHAGEHEQDEEEEEKAAPAAPAGETRPGLGKPLKLKTPFVRKEGRKPMLGRIKAIHGGGGDQKEEAVN
ncbi:methyl-accepting chemotaxis protein [Nitrososphaera viennensis]|uniref:Methyl-accepting chemotaxis protein n=1 Tax=Nitrososphaera viennensis TaxID=1034015 RepID=A0A977IG26_9ARCH|nr:methyl-accepting chemotaxis protein [Nitrososphaera viennensis]UVS70122.1 methyl-accepting chemotaxis protein [Nitrososphaera viennensis]